MSAHRDAIRRYDFHSVDQFEAQDGPDMLPEDPRARDGYLRLLATDATIYGLPAVYEYAQLYEQAVDAASQTYTGFNTFLHQRDLSTPEFTAFKTPNVDTLYSNAWLDLTGGPLLITVPPIEDRYYTLHFVDLYGNASNLSSRTVGGGGGTFHVAPSTWEGEVPAGTIPFRVATPYAWILMRILVRDAGQDTALVRRLQDAVELMPTSPPKQVPFVAVTFDEVQDRADRFFAAMDWVIRHNGHPVQEQAHVHRFRSLGLGGAEPFDPATVGPDAMASIDAGFAEGMSIIASSRGQVGWKTATGWRTGTAGEMGFNYLHRAIQNFVGTGGNVAAEKKFFVTFEDGGGRGLDGAEARYTLTFETLPPVNGHWSLTAYPQSTGLLYGNEIDRWAIASTTEGLVTGDDGSVTLLIQHERPEQIANWLPVPAAPFYLDIRMWDPRPEARDGSWIPPLINRSTR